MRRMVRMLWPTPFLEAGTERSHMFNHH